MGLHVCILNVAGKDVLFTIQLLFQAPLHTLISSEHRLWSQEYHFAMAGLAAEIHTLSGRNAPFTC